MKSSEEMTREILRLESQISTINEQIANYEEKKRRAENEHTKAIQNGLKSGEFDDGPGPGDAFAKALNHGLRAKALRKAKLDLEAKLDQAKAHLDLARLFESIIPHIEDIEPIFHENLRAIENGIKALNEKLNYLSETIEIFMRETVNPLDAIEALLKNPLLSGLSLQAFFTGVIQQATAHENDDFIQAIGRKYLQLANGLPRLRDIEDSWMLLSNRLDNLARQAQNLIPHRLKYISTPQPKPKPQHGSTTRIAPKPPAKALTNAEKQARAARRAAAIYR